MITVLSFSFLIRDLKDGRGKNLFLSCVSDVVMESREASWKCIDCHSVITSFFFVFSISLKCSWGKSYPIILERYNVAAGSLYLSCAEASQLISSCLLFQPGCVDKFAADIDLIGFVAGEAEEKGLFEDAVRLYDLSGVCMYYCTSTVTHDLWSFSRS